MLPRPLTNFEKRMYDQNESRLSGVYSRDNLSKKIKDGTYVINLAEYADVGTHWIALYVKDNEIIYFDSYKTKHILGYKQFNNVWIVLHRIHWLMLGGKTVIDFTSLFSLYDFLKNDNIVLSYFKNEWM